MEDLGWTILYIPKFYKVISSKGGKFYTFKNLTRSSAQGVEYFILSKSLTKLLLDLLDSTTVQIFLYAGEGYKKWDVD